MNTIRFICFGESKYNLEMAIKYNVVGVSRTTKFTEGEMVYFVIKKNNEWHVCGRAHTGAETDLNPFEKPERYYGYQVYDVETCDPYPINSICRETFGKYWGLKFQRPALIDEKGLINDITNKFSIIDSVTMLARLEK